MAKSAEAEGKVYVVTGANKGVGLCIVRGLCKVKKDADVVYLCSRYVALTFISFHSQFYFVCLICI